MNAGAGQSSGNRDHRDDPSAGRERGRAVGLRFELEFDADFNSGLTGALRGHVVRAAS
eukprot:COSAG05_NODE_407_length_10145_cov_234.042604_2_plen_58_part_00